MKNLPKYLLILICFCTSTMIKAQDNSATALRPVSIGVEFFSLDWSDYNSFYAFPAKQLTLSVNASDMVRIEPSFGFISSENKDSGEEFQTVSLGLGLYALKRIDRINYQYGIAVKKLDIDYEDTEFEEKSESDVIQVGPSVGAEYMISDRFSVSAKAGFSKIFASETYEDGFNDSKTKSEGWQSDTSIIIRFYF